MYLEGSGLVPGWDYILTAVKCYLHQVTQEEIEAYRMKKVHHDDPMKDFLWS